MRSPFPGMDPYLEAHWGDVHARLVMYACDQLQGDLPSGLVARVEERVYFESAEEGRSSRPDVRIVEDPSRAAIASSRGTATLEVAKPFVIEHLDPITETHVSIYDRSSGNRLITSLEVISPTNKLPGKGRKLYRRKQREHLRAGVSLVEIDLLRDGEDLFDIPETMIPPAYRTPYRICIRRGWKTETEVYRAPLRERLPVLPIPLRQTDRDAILDLQALLDQTYKNGRYDSIDYKSNLYPELSTDDTVWANALLKEAGKR